MKSVESKLESAAICVCCGYQAQSLKSKTPCRFCRWDDDGSDNETAFRYSARNQTNLNLARYESLRNGVAADAAQQARFFSIDETGSFIEERAKNGKLVYRGPIPFVEYAAHGKGIVAAIPLPKNTQKRPKRSA